MSVAFVRWNRDRTCADGAATVDCLDVQNCRCFDACRQLPRVTRLSNAKLQKLLQHNSQKRAIACTHKDPYSDPPMLRRPDRATLDQARSISSKAMKIAVD